MSPPKELPGFYYDSEKNRYFPIKGPIPGSNKRPKLDPCSSSSSSNKEPKFHVIRSGKTLKASKLINLREIQGRDIFSNSKRCLFRDQYEKLQASQPMVWKYEPNKPVADGALELVSGTIESLNGSKDVVLLATGGTDGKISFFEMRNSSSEDSDADYRQTEILANPIWPHADLLPNRASSIWQLNLMRHALVFPSETSCIKCSPLSSHKHALYPFDKLILKLNNDGVLLEIGI
ncbi:hypothetical protein LUZ60_009540 [Juncus effusus]|nr:hypothetical protein LUZ60_009540 [Juncus effusus]